MWKNFVVPGKPQMTIWRMRIACWIPKKRNTLSKYVILIAFQLQQCFRKSASVLRYTYIVCRVVFLPFVCVSETDFDATDRI